MNKLGRTSEGQKILNELASGPSKKNAGKNAGAYDFYVAGLAERARDHAQQAGNDFRRALELDPSLWEARLEAGNRE